jgi:enoyl-[acyl-carrier protein] reductase I
MGPVKAALEAATRYMAAELGPKGIRVHALSPGPLKTRAASAISTNCFTPPRPAPRSISSPASNDVGAYAAFLASAEAANVTGGVHSIDGGYHILG